MALNFDAFMQAARANQAQFQNKSWWPDYERAYSQGKDALLNWAQTAGQNYSDFDGLVDGNFVGSQVAGLQAINSNSSWDKVGDVGSTLGKAGLAASLLYAGGVGAGLVGDGAAAGAAGAEGAGAAGAGSAAGDAAVAGGAGTDALAGGGGLELGSGISSGSSATGIGGGATGTGITAGSTASGLGDGAIGTGVSGASAPGALAPGYFASETAYPAIGGIASGIASSGATSGAASSALGGLTAADLLRGVPGVLGALASKNQSDQLTDLAHEYMNLGAPSRARFESSFAPGFTMNNDPGYLDALNQSAKATLHGLSISGNPADSPNAWAKSLQDLYEKSAYPALQNYRATNGSAGGLAALTGASPSVATAGINAQGNVAASLGGAAADIFTPRKSLADILKDMR